MIHGTPQQIVDYIFGHNTVHERPYDPITKDGLYASKEGLLAQINQQLHPSKVFVLIRRPMKIGTFDISVVDQEVSMEKFDITIK